MSLQLSKQGFRQNFLIGLWSSAFFSLLSRGLGFVSSLILFGALNLQEYGTYQLGLATWGFFTLFLLQGLGQLALSHAAKSTAAEDVKGSLESVFGFFLLMSMLCTGLFIVVQAFVTLVAKGVDSQVLDMVRLLSFTLFFLPLQGTIKLLLQHDQRFVDFNLMSFTEDVLKISFVVYAFFLLRMQTAGVVIFSAIMAGFVSTLIFAFRIRRRLFAMVALNARTSLLSMWDIVRREGVWAIMQKHLRQLGQNARIYLIESMLGREAVALYAFGEKVLTQFMSAVPLDDILVPVLSLSVRNEQRVSNIYRYGLKYGTIFYVAMATVLSMVIGPLVSWIFPTYVGAIPLLRVLLLYLPFASMTYMMSSLFLSHQNQKTQFFLVLARWIWFWPFAIILVRTFGVVGFALENVISLIAFNALRYRALVVAAPAMRIDFLSLFNFSHADIRIAKQALSLLVGKICGTAHVEKELSPRPKNIMNDGIL